MSGPLWGELGIETVGSCNRTCPTCMRNSYPNRRTVAERFGKQHRLPTAVIQRIIDEAADLGFTGWVNLQWFNEPLQDPRIADIAAYAKAKGQFAKVYMHSNGDLLTKRKAAALDGVLDELTIALYDETGGQPLDPERTAERRALISSWFSQTTLTWTTATHIVTHFSPYANLKEAIVANRPTPCRREVQLRCIINYQGEMMMCC